jgi:succinoglycan biosynthesis transport protein ExoP
LVICDGYITDNGWAGEMRWFIPVVVTLSVAMWPFDILRPKRGCMRAPITREPAPLHQVPPRESQLSIAREAPASGLLPVASAPSPKEPIAFSRMVGMLARQYRIVLLTLIASLLAALAMERNMTPLYTSSAQIMVQRVATNGTAPSSADRERALRSEQDLIVSTPVLATALTMPGVHDISPLRGHADALKLIKQQIRVDTSHGDDLLNISYDTVDPREGTLLLAAVVDSYVRFRSGVHAGSTDGSAATVLAERQKALQTLKQNRDALQQFGTDHGLAQGNEQVDTADEVLHELGVRLATARVQTVAAKAAFDQMQHDLVDDPRMRDRLLQDKDNDSSLAAGDDQAIAKHICTLQDQLAGYGTKFMANYEPVQLLHRKIEDLKLTRDAIIQQRWEAADRTESELQASYNQEETAAAKSEANEQMYDQRKADVAEAQKQVAAFDKQLRDLDAVNKLITTMVTVIEPATASDRPTSPHTAMILLIAAIAGVSLGCALGAINDRSVVPATPGNLKSLGAGLPLLARLPAVSRRQLSMNSWRDRMVDSAAEFAEACRKVEGALESVASFAGGRTVLVTSTNTGEGKSTLTSLLALTLARNGKRVLLVDANLHAPQQAEIFGIDSDFGLGQLLEREVESNFVIHVHPGSDPRMDILLAGSTTISIEELFNSQHFTNLMAAMAAEYDYVLIDSPALSVGSDARIIASSCDATILLANETNINHKMLGKTRDSLTAVAANVIGVVINGGMGAIERPEARPAVATPRPAPVQVMTLHPVPAVNVSAEVEPVQTVVAAQVRRADSGTHTDLDELQGDGDRQQSFWSYALVLILLLGGWMAFHGIWGGQSMHRYHGLQTGRVISSDDLLSAKEEPVSMLLAGAGLAVALITVGFRTRPPRHETTLLALSALLGVCAWNLGVTDILWSQQQPKEWLPLATETTLLFATLVFGWFAVRRFNPLQTPAQTLDAAEPTTVADAILAIFAQASVMAALMILLNSWHSKGECLIVTAFSSCLAAMLASWLAPMRSSLLLWFSPLFVALFGYGCAAVGAQGIHTGMLVALARPLPMDYASMGPIGAVLGFWIARSMGRIGWQSPLVAH